MGGGRRGHGGAAVVVIIARDTSCSHDGGFDHGPIGGVLVTDAIMIVLGESGDSDRHIHGPVSDPGAHAH